MSGDRKAYWARERRRFKPDPNVSRGTTTLSLPDGANDDIEVRIVWEVSGKGVDRHPEHSGETLVLGSIIDRRTGLERLEELYERVYAYMREEGVGCLR